MTKTAERPHSVSIALTLLGLVLTAAGLYFSNKDKIDPMLGIKPVTLQPVTDGPTQKPTPNPPLSTSTGSEQHAADSQVSPPGAGRSSAVADTALQRLQHATDEARIQKLAADFAHLSEKFAWISPALRGNYNGQAADTRVEIRQIGSHKDENYSLIIYAPQATFRCKLEFADVLPHVASSCVVQNKAGEPWWTDDRIQFSCVESHPGIVCSGPYTLHLQSNDRSHGQLIPPSQLTMRISRPW